MSKLTQHYEQNKTMKCTGNKIILNCVSHSMSNDQDFTKNFVSVLVSNNNEFQQSKSSEKKYAVPNRIRKEEYLQMSEKEKDVRKKTKAKERSQRFRDKHKLKTMVLQTNIEEEETKKKNLEDKYNFLLRLKEEVLQNVEKGDTQ